MSKVTVCMTLLQMICLILKSEIIQILTTQAAKLSRYIFSLFNFNAMKTTFKIVLLFALFSTHIYAQDCEPFSNSAEIIHGKLKQTLLVGEDGIINPLQLKTGIGPDGDLDTRTYAPLIYSSSIWAGGLDPSGNIKLAAGAYNEQDWSPGPLDNFGGTDFSVCNQWDRIWTVSKEEILKAREIFLNGNPCEEISSNILNWPARNNPNLSFLIEDQSLADFWDQNGDGVYQPCDGDLPLVNISGCEASTLEGMLDQTPSNFSFYIMNDNGAAHNLSNATPIQLEVHVTSFTFKSQEAEGIIFFKHKIINKASEDIRQMNFGQWMDFDLGCSTNDKMGSDKERQMIYAYNGSSEVDCGENSLEEKQIAVGFTYLRGPLGPFIIVEGSDGQDSLAHPPIGSGSFDTLAELKASSAMIPSDCFDPSQPVNCNPQSTIDYFNLLNGKNFDGSFPLDNNGIASLFMYSGNPADEDQWSLCTDERIAETTGILSVDNLLLLPQAINEIVSAVYYTDDIDSDCPDVAAIKFKDELVQRLYDNCFAYYAGPPPPKFQVIYNDVGVDIQFSEIPTQYSERITEAISGLHDDLNYSFEGVKVYQVASKNFDIDELDNPELSKLVYQGDIVNQIVDISNFKSDFDGAIQNWNEELKVEGSNQGIQIEFTLEYDYIRDQPIDISDELFYVAVSYGYNNYEVFDPIGIITANGNVIATGQQYRYIESTCGLGIEEAVISVSQTNSPYELGLYDYIYSENVFNLFNIQEDLSLELYSIDGKSLEQWNAKNGTSFTTNNLSHQLPSGLYILHVEATASRSIGNHKLVVVR